MMLKNKHHCFLLFIAVIVSLSVQAQQSYNQSAAYLKANSVWTFGNYAGLNLNSGHPVAITDSFNDNPAHPGTSFAFNEGGASVADAVTGNLLFYYDGLTCRNKNHHIMPNGKNIMGKAYTTTQGSVIMPVIDSPGKYYLFTLYGPTGYGTPDDAHTDASGGFLFYSKIDMSLNGGLGDVVPGAKNIILDKDSLSESMIAVPGDNCDAWLIVHKLQYAQFRAYHITRNGIDPNPVISNTGSQIQGGVDTLGTSFPSYQAGGMAVSPDRSMLTITSCNVYAALFQAGLGYVPAGWIGVLLCKFDPATGVVSDALQVEKNLTPYTLAFSPDNSKLYMINVDLGALQKSLDQYDVSTYDSAAIAKSKKTISSVPASDPLEGYLKLYGDTIYINTNPGLSVLSTINKPNLSGTACDYQYGSIALSAGTSTQIGLPNDVIAAPHPDTVSTVTDTVICSGWADGIKLIPSLVISNYNYLWNDNSTDSSLNVTDSGVYWVMYDDGCHYRVDSFLLHGSDLDPVITTEEFTLGTVKSYDSYQWLLNDNVIPGATDSTYTVTENGSYRVVVSDGTCTDTSEPYIVKNVSTNDIRSLAARIRIYPNPAHDLVYVNAPEKVNLELTTIAGKRIRKVFQTKTISVKALPEGIYFLRISNLNGTLLKVQKLVKAE